MMDCWFCNSISLNRSCSGYPYRYRKYLQYCLNSSNRYRRVKIISTDSIPGPWIIRNKTLLLPSRVPLTLKLNRFCTEQEDNTHKWQACITLSTTVTYHPYIKALVSDQRSVSADAPSQRGKMLLSLRYFLSGNKLRERRILHFPWCIFHRAPPASLDAFLSVM